MRASIEEGESSPKATEESLCLSAALHLDYSARPFISRCCPLAHALIHLYVRATGMHGLEGGGWPSHTCPSSRCAISRLLQSGSCFQSLSFTQLLLPCCESHCPLLLSGYPVHDHIVLLSSHSQDDLIPSWVPALDTELLELCF